MNNIIKYTVIIHIQVNISFIFFLLLRFIFLYCASKLCRSIITGKAVDSR